MVKSLVNPPLGRLFRPRGIAVVGASRRPGSLGARTVEYVLRRSGGVPVHLINPAASEVAGVPCYPALSDAPGGAIDVAFLVVPAEAAPEQVEMCAERGVSFAVIGSSGFAEVGSTGVRLQSELGEVIRRTGVRVVGPNTNGVWNAIDGISIGFNVSHGIDLRPGGIGLAAQSGAMLGSILKRLSDLGAGISYAVTTGNEEDLELADYIDFLADDESTSCLLLVIDAIRNAKRFAEAVLAARQRGKPVIALKLGKSSEGIQAAHLHSSRLAGQPESFAALLRKLGVAEAPDPDVLTGAAYLVERKKDQLGNRLCAVSTSGGGAALLGDYADRFGFKLPPFSSEAASSLREQLRFTSPHNPMDLTGQSFDREWVSSVFATLMGQEGFDALVYLITLLYPDDARVHAVADLARHSPKPVVAYTPGRLAPDLEDALQEAGVLLAHSAFEAFASLRTAVDAVTSENPIESGWISTLPGGRFGDGAPRSAPSGGRLVLHDEARPRLEAIGIRFLREETVLEAGQVEAAARRVGLPVALKVLAEDLPHKALRGGVRLGLRTTEEAASAAAELLRLPASKGRVLIQPMVPTGIEFYLGYRFDLQAGPIVILGFGGGDVESERDVAHGVAPLTGREVEGLLDSLRGTGRLRKWVSNLEPLIMTIQKFSEFVARHWDSIQSLEINPLVVPADGIPIALDVRLLATDDGGKQ